MDDQYAISIRHLKAIIYVAEARNISRAAHLLSRSRTAVSKSLSDLEKQLGVLIFTKSPSGYVATKEGKVILSRANIIYDIFTRLAQSYQLAHKRPQPIKTIPLFTMDIAAKRLKQLALLTDTESVEEAARLGHISSSAIYKSVHDLEQQLDLPLFARLPNGRVIPVEFGELLCQQVKLVLSQIRHLQDDIKTIHGQHDGVIRIGSLPSMNTYVLPVALAKLAASHPEITVHIDSRPYTQMEKDLLNGDLEVIIGGTRSGSNTDGLRAEVLAEDKIVMVTGTNHSLAKKNNLSKNDFNDVTWALPVSGTPSREMFENSVNQSGIHVGKVWVESGSVTTLRGILMSSEAIMIGTKYQTSYEQSLGLLKILPFELTDNDWPLGLTLRAQAPPSKRIDFFITCLRETLDEIQQGIMVSNQDWATHFVAN